MIIQNGTLQGGFNRLLILIMKTTSLQILIGSPKKKTGGD